MPGSTRHWTPSLSLAWVRIHVYVCVHYSALLSCIAAPQMGFFKIYTDFKRVKREYDLEKLADDRSVADKIHTHANPLAADESRGLDVDTFALTKDELKHVPPDIIQSYMAKYDPDHEQISKKDLKESLALVYKGDLPVTTFFASLDALEFDQTIEDFWDAEIVAAVQELKELHKQEKLQVEEDEVYELPYMQRAILMSELAELNADESSGGTAAKKEHSAHSAAWLTNRLQGDEGLNDQWAADNPRDCKKEQATFSIRWWRGASKWFCAELLPEALVYHKVTEEHSIQSQVVGHLRSGDMVQVINMRFDEQAGRWGGIRLFAEIHRVDESTQTLKMLVKGWFSAAAPPDHHHYTAWVGVLLRRTEEEGRYNHTSTVLPGGVRLRYFAMRHALATELTKMQGHKHKGTENEQALQMWHDECRDCIAIDDSFRAAGHKKKDEEEDGSELGLVDWRGQQMYCRLVGTQHDHAFGDGIVAVGLDSVEDRVKHVKHDKKGHNKQGHWTARPSQVVELYDLVVLSKRDERRGWVPTAVRASVSGCASEDGEDPTAGFATGWLTVSCPELPSTTKNGIRVRVISLAEFNESKELDWPTKPGTCMRVVQSAVVRKAPSLASKSVFKQDKDGRSGQLQPGQVCSLSIRHLDFPVTLNFRHQYGLTSCGMLCRALPCLAIPAGGDGRRRVAGSRQRTCADHGLLRVYVRLVSFECQTNRS